MLVQSCLGRNESSIHIEKIPAEITCDEMRKLLEKVVRTSNRLNYDMNVHLKNMNEQEIIHIEAITNVISPLLGLTKEEFYTNGENVKNKLDQTIFPTVQPKIDAELLEEANIVKNNLNCVKDLFETMLRGVRAEMRTIQTYKFNKYHKPLRLYHAIYRESKNIFDEIDGEYEKITKKLEDRIQSDQEKCDAKPISIYIFGDKERDDTLTTFDRLFQLDLGQSKIDLDDIFHPSTDKMIHMKLELGNIYNEYKDTRKLAKRIYCNVAYLCFKKLRPTSVYNAFDKEYDNKTNEEFKNHRYLKNELPLDDLIQSFGSPIHANESPYETPRNGDEI